MSQTPLPSLAGLAAGTALPTQGNGIRAWRCLIPAA